MWWRQRPRRGDRGAPPRHAPATGAADLVDVAALVRRRCAIWEPRCRARGITLETAFEVPEALRAPDELAVVIDALLSNAHRFCDRGDRVTVWLRTSGDGFELQISDTGIGIPAEDLPHVFDRFYRGQIGRDRALGGSGLGLSIAREIAAVHGGSIRADSVIGEGSCFRLTMPAASIPYSS